MNLIKSRKRVADHGEVFTPSWLVAAMLDLVSTEVERIDSRFLEPACGSGNFLVEVLRRKLAAVEIKFGKSPFERRHYALLALMCVYGIELLEDNISECRANLREVIIEFLGRDYSEDLIQAAEYVLANNLILGDALTMTSKTGKPIVFAEWGYLGKGKFQRRDFRLDVLATSSSIDAQDRTSPEFGKHDIFTPSKSYFPMKLPDMAAAYRECAREDAS